MGLTIHIGWWALPLAVTIGLIWSAIAASPKRGGDYDFGYAAVSAIYLLGAVATSLIAWLIWALAA